MQLGTSAVEPVTLMTVRIMIRQRIKVADDRLNIYNDETRHLSTVDVVFDDLKNLVSRNVLVVFYLSALDGIL